MEQYALYRFKYDRLKLRIGSEKFITDQFRYLYPVFEQ